MLCNITAEPGYHVLRLRTGRIHMYRRDSLGVMLAYIALRNQGHHGAGGNNTECLTFVVTSRPQFSVKVMTKFVEES